MDKSNKETMIKCFCEARKTQAFFTKCLNDNATDEEREFLMELVKESAATSKKILDFCKKP
jgi:major intracellular serine protease